MASVEFFPYEPRPTQEELIQFIRGELEARRSICINAVAGYGKTPVILAAVLPYAISQDLKILWAVRTGTETDRPIEELKAIQSFLAERKRIAGFSYRGKKDMCLLLRDSRIETKEEFDPGEVSFFCKSHKSDCRYLANCMRIREEDVSKLIASPKLYSEILEICDKKRLCPYKIQTNLLREARVIALSYNYIIDEGMSWAIKSKIDYENSLLVVDEAHNLQKVCSNLNSDSITLGTVRSAIREIERFKREPTAEIQDFLQTMRDEMEKMLADLKDNGESQFDPESFLEKASRGLTLDILSEIFDEMEEYGVRIRIDQLRRGRRPRSSLYHLAIFWRRTVGSLDREGIAFLASKDVASGAANLTLELWDMRSSEILREKWKNFHACIFCSGTIEPIPAFAETIGLDQYSSRSIPSPYTAKNLTALITRGLSTKGEVLPRRMAEAYLKAIEAFIKALDENLAVFSASYRIQRDLLDLGLEEMIEEHKRKPFIEYHGMLGREGRRLLEAFKEQARSKRKGVLCATMTGRFSEGADYPSKELEGIFLVGVPFDRMSTRTRVYLDYYKRLYGKTKGTYLGYIVPALRRTGQSLGRALRSTEDRAVIILGDERYAQNRFFTLLPDYARGTAKLIEADTEDIRTEICEYWNKNN
jgi:DNA excision repair protein ERCC-2